MILSLFSAQVGQFSQLQRRQPQAKLTGSADMSLSGLQLPLGKLPLLPLQVEGAAALKAAEPSALQRELCFSCAAAILPA